MSWNNIVQNAQNAAENGQEYLGTEGSIEGTILENWFLPGVVQNREFGQQVALQQMQNEWNSETEKMKRMKEAGINVNTAAAGIAGAGASPSSGAPNSAIGAGAQGVGAAAQGLSSLANLGDTALSAYQKLNEVPIGIKETKAHIVELLSNALHNKWLARSISELLPYQKLESRSHTLLQLAQFRNAKEDFYNIKERVNEIKTHIDEMKAQASLFEKQGNLADSQAHLAEAQAAGVNLDNDEKQWYKDWREKYGFDGKQPISVALEQAIVNGADESVVDSIGEAIELDSYRENIGKFDARVQTIYDEVFNNEKAKNDVAAEFAQFFNDQEIYKDFVQTIIHLRFSHDGSEISNLINRIISTFDANSTSKFMQNDWLSFPPKKGATSSYKPRHQ